MKRGLISWDRDQLPAEAFDDRLDTLYRSMSQYDVPAAVVYTDVWRSNDVRYLSNFMPYWNRAFAVVPLGGRPILLCSLSPRVYPWIKSVTIHETIVPSPSLPVQLAKLCTERGWTHLGVIDFAGLPNDLYTQLASAPYRVVDMSRGSLRPHISESEVAMHEHAARQARMALETQIIGDGVGLTDYQLAGRLERRLRRAGAEDLVVLVSNGTSAPLPAAGNPVSADSSVVVCLEYNGHWAKVARNIRGVTCQLPPPPGTTVQLQTLSGIAGWEGISSLHAASDAVVSVQVQLTEGGKQLFYGETCVQSRDGLEIL